MASLELQPQSAESTKIALEQRESSGHIIQLLWEEGTDSVSVTVSDTRTGSEFELPAENGKQALDIFNHPFAYGGLGPLAIGSQQEAA